MKCELAEPPGVRSCRDIFDSPGTGGEWGFPGEPTEQVGWFSNDLHLQVEDLCEDEQSLMRYEIRDVMQRASRGELFLRRTKDEEGDAEQMVRDERILEMKLSDRQERPPGVEPWKIRVYYTEPAHEYRCLLFLHLKGKRGGEEGLAEQNRHIDEAARRLDEHYA